MLFETNTTHTYFYTLCTLANSLIKNQAIIYNYKSHIVIKYNVV